MLADHRRPWSETYGGQKKPPLPQSDANPFRNLGGWVVVWVCGPPWVLACVAQALSPSLPQYICCC